MMQLASLLSQYETIGLREMNNAMLQDRVDTKFVLSIKQIDRILEQLSADYRILEIKGQHLNRYQTLYFDTPDFDLFRQHHNDWGSRYKVRARKYVESNLAFFEVKHKTNQNRTIKSRIPLQNFVIGIDDDLQQFVGAHLADYEASKLEAKLWNNYLRATLVSKHRAERVTLDFEVSFAWDGIETCLDGLVIAEVKQDQSSHDSEFIQVMKSLGIRPLSFSKYCVGVSLLYDGVKMNNFKAKMRQIDKLMQEVQHELR